MPSQVAIGDLGNTETLKYQYIWKKATGGGSAILPGKVVKLTESTGVAALAPTTAGLIGPFGVVPNLYPLNTDSDDTLTVITGGGEVYVRADGVIKPNQRVMPSTTTAGEVIAYTAPVAGTPTAAEVNTAAEAQQKIIGYYVGHVDEGSGLVVEATDAADGDIVRIKLIGGL